MKDEQKYFGEAAVLQATKGVALLKPVELPGLAKSSKHLKQIEESHIYFVCQRPRIRLVAGGKRKSDGIPFTLNVTDKGGTLTKNFLIPDKVPRPEVKAIEPERNGVYWSSQMGCYPAASFGCWPEISNPGAEITDQVAQSSRI
jgi:hypothetical protein